MKRTFDVKVVGYEGFLAESEEDALEQFDAFMQKGYTVSDLRWKSVCAFDVEVGGETEKEELERLLAETRRQLANALAKGTK